MLLLVPLVQSPLPLLQVQVVCPLLLLLALLELLLLLRPLLPARQVLPVPRLELLFPLCPPPLPRFLPRLALASL